MIDRKTRPVGSPPNATGDFDNASMWARERAIPHATLPKSPSRPKAVKLWKIPVKVLFNDSRLCATVRKVHLQVIAPNARDAANWVRDKLETIPETEIYAYGPRGGEEYRYIGYHSAIGSQLRGNWKTDEEIRADLDLILSGDETFGAAQP